MLRGFYFPPPDKDSLGLTRVRDSRFAHETPQAAFPNCPFPLLNPRHQVRRRCSWSPVLESCRPRPGLCSTHLPWSCSVTTGGGDLASTPDALSQTVLTPIPQAVLVPHVTEHVHVCVCVSVSMRVCEHGQVPSSVPLFSGGKRR